MNYYFMDALYLQICLTQGIIMMIEVGLKKVKKEGEEDMIHHMDGLVMG